MTKMTNNRAKLRSVASAVVVGNKVFVEVEGGVTQTFSVGTDEYRDMVAQGVQPTPADDHPQLWAEVRRLRDELLSSCDWTQLPDVPEETKLKWQTYRQALRDITETYTLSSEVVWPLVP